MGGGIVAAAAVQNAWGKFGSNQLELEEGCCRLQVDCCRGNMEELYYKEVVGYRQDYYNSLLVQLVTENTADS